MRSMGKFRAFRVNPVEVMIFAGVSIIFANSIYHLFNEKNGTTLALQLTPQESSVQDTGRSPASVTPMFISVDLPCDENGVDSVTQAGKVRILGSLCGGSETPQKAQIVNQANQFAATVFTDSNAGKYSTDYIPLNSGKNPIRVTFTSTSGKVITKEVIVTKE